MADKRISQLVERTDIANNDVLPIVASGATTTNKVTISTIQDWMQDNLDVGVTSVGLTLGTTGTDVNVTGSPITTSGNITINIPNASATARGVVSTGSQVFGGVKTFSNGFILPSAGGSNQASRFVNIGTIHEGSAGSNQIGFNNSNNIYFGKGLSNGGVIQWTNAAVRYYTLPDADGTIALASQLDGYVTLGTAQTITGQKTFSTSGSSDTAIINHGSGSGIALNITKAGNGEGLRVAKTSGSGNAVTITGGILSAEAGQFSGDLQSATRVIAAASSQSIILTPNSGGTTNRVESVGTLPLALVSAAAITMAAGGTTPQITLATTGAVTLTGALNGTSASFTGLLTISANSSANAIAINGRASDSTASIDFFQNNGTTRLMEIGVSPSGAEFYYDANSPMIFYTNGSPRLTLASTGAATFSSSVTVGGGVGHKIELKDGAAWPSIRRNTSTGGIIFDTEGSSIAGSILSVKTLNGSDFVTVQSSGNVGIGTASPTAIGTGYGALDVRGTPGGGFWFGKTDGTASSYLGSDSGGGFLYTYSNMPLYFGTNNTERMRITSGGNVGINNNNPTSKLHILNGADGFTARFTGGASNNIICGIYSHSTTGGGFASIGVQSGHGFNLFTSDLDRLAVTAGGQIFMYALATGAGTNALRYSTATGQVTYDTSSARYKDNIRESTYGLNDVMQLKSSMFEYKEDGRTDIGLIAEEVYDVIPELVALDKDGEPDAVSYDRFISVLIKAIQELKTEIDSLKTK
jgi:hypothetical protein